MSRSKLEVWIAVGEDGDYEVSTTKEDASERYVDQIGAGGALALYCLTVDVPLPAARLVAVTLADDVPADVLAAVTECPVGWDKIEADEVSQ